MRAYVYIESHMSCLCDSQKPAVYGEIFERSREWIENCASEERGGWWVTSAPESNVGLGAIAFSGRRPASDEKDRGYSNPGVFKAIFDMVSTILYADTEASIPTYSSTVLNNAM